MRPERAKINLTLDEAMRHNLLLFNNPVLIQGLALTPVVAAATTLRTAVILAVIAPVMIVPTRLAGDLLIGFVAKNLRPFIYAVVSALCYIPAMLLANLIFGAASYGAANYFVLMVVDGIVLSRAEIPAREGVGKALSNGLLTAVGLALVLALTGGLREILGSGKIWGYLLSIGAVMPVFGTVAGGFIMVALLSALLQWGGARYKRSAAGGARTDE